MVRPKKRYVLFQAEGPMSGPVKKKVSELLTREAGKAALIEVKGRSSALILKTDLEGAARIRWARSTMEVDGVSVDAVLTSGAIGKLKKRALGSG